MCVLFNLREKDKVTRAHHNKSSYIVVLGGVEDAISGPKGGVFSAIESVC